MDAQWWLLPGPQRFVDTLFRGLLDGRCLAVALPRFAPAGLGTALGDRVHSSGLWVCHRLDLRDEACAGAPPASVILRQCGLGLPSGRLADASGLATCEAFGQHAVLVEGGPPATWGAWREFLTRYAAASRALPEHARGRLCLVAEGCSERDLPVADVTLGVHRWRGVLDRLDVMLFAAGMVRERTMPRLHRELVLALAVELGGTDPELVANLATLDVAAATSPAPALEAFAARRGWSAATTVDWAQGTHDVIAAQDVVHAALLVHRQDGVREIARRVWRAELGLLFPFIEEYRVRLIEQLGTRLRVPWSTPRGEVRDRRDLEVAHLLAQARTIRGVERYVPLLEHLRVMRNALAHLEPVPPDVLAAPEVLRAYEGC